jgi:preprotein translocase subunit YajC
MILVTTSKRMWLAGLAVSLIIFGVVYFTVIKPDNTAANQAVKSGMQQSEQVIKQAQKQVTSAEKQAGTVATKTDKKANQQLGNAAKLASCIAAAGTDTSKLASCQSKYGD